MEGYRNIPISRLLASPLDHSDTSFSSCSHSSALRSPAQPAHLLIALADVDDDEAKATFGAEVCSLLASTSGISRLEPRRPRAFSLDADRSVASNAAAGPRAILFSLPADNNFSIHSILGDPNNSSDFGMPVKDFLRQVDATVVELKGEGISSSFMAARAVMEQERHRPLSSVRARLRVVDFPRWLDHLRTTEHPTHRRVLSGSAKTPDYENAFSPSGTPSTGLVRSMTNKLRPFSLTRILNPPYSKSWDPTPMTYQPCEDPNAEELCADLSTCILEDLPCEYPPSFRAMRLRDDDDGLKLVVWAAARSRAALCQQPEVSFSPSDMISNAYGLILVLQDTDVRSSFKIAEAITSYARATPLACAIKCLRPSPLRRSLVALSPPPIQDVRNLLPSFRMTQMTQSVPPPGLRTRSHTTCSALKHLGTRFIPRSTEFTRRRCFSELPTASGSDDGSVNTSGVSVSSSLTCVDVRSTASSSQDLASTTALSPPADPLPDRVHASLSHKVADRKEEDFKPPVRTTEISEHVTVTRLPNVLTPVDEEEEPTGQAPAMASPNLPAPAWLSEEAVETKVGSVISTKAGATPLSSPAIHPDVAMSDTQDASFGTSRVRSALQSVVSSFNVSGAFDSLTKGRRALYRMISRDHLDADHSLPLQEVDWADEWISIQDIPVLLSPSLPLTEAHATQATTSLAIDHVSPPRAPFGSVNTHHVLPDIAPATVNDPIKPLRRAHTSEGVSSRPRKLRPMRASANDGGENRVVSSVLRSASLKLKRTSLTHGAQSASPLSPLTSPSSRAHGPEAQPMAPHMPSTHSSSVKTSKVTRSKSLTWRP